MTLNSLDGKGTAIVSDKSEMVDRRRCEEGLEPEIGELSLRNAEIVTAAAVEEDEAAAATAVEKDGAAATPAVEKDGASRESRRTKIWPTTQTRDGALARARENE